MRKKIKNKKKGQSRIPRRLRLRIQICFRDTIRSTQINVPTELARRVLAPKFGEAEAPRNSMSPELFRG